MSRNVGQTMVAGTLLSVVLLSGCGGARHTASDIDLNVTITRGVVQKTATEQSSGVYRFRLRCRPDGGVSVAPEACRAIAATPAMLRAPRGHRYCIGGFPSPPSVDVTGRVGTSKVALHAGGCDMAPAVRIFVARWMAAMQCTPERVPGVERCAGRPPSAAP